MLNGQKTNNRIIVEKNIRKFSSDVSDYGGYVYTANNILSSELANKHITQITLSLINFHKKRIVDIGCGDGTYTESIFVLGKPKNIIGIDPADRAVRIAIQKYARTSRIKFKVGNIYNLPDKTYDVAVIRGVLHHLYNPSQAMEKISKIAKEIIIIEPNGYNPILKLIEKISKYHIEHEEKSYSPPQINSWITSNDGKIVSRKYGGLVPFFCPDLLARTLKFIEPFVEKIPFLNKFICANYYVVYKTS